MITLAAVVLMNWAAVSTKYGTIYEMDSKSCPIAELSKIAFYAELETKDGRIIKGCHWRDHYKLGFYYSHFYEGFQSLDGTVRFVARRKAIPSRIRSFQE